MILMVKMVLETVKIDENMLEKYLYFEKKNKDKIDEWGFAYFLCFIEWGFA